jgi:hypothetical protein
MSRHQFDLDGGYGWRQENEEGLLSDETDLFTDHAPMFTGI